MSIICSVDYATALQYKGKVLNTKYNNKKHKVYLKLVGDDFTLSDCIELAKSSKNILMVDYQGLESNMVYEGLTANTGVYIGRVTDFGNDITAEDVGRIVNSTPSGVVPIINLPSDFKDIYTLAQLSKVYPQVRFCGGNLFAIDGVKVGAIGVDVLRSVSDKLTEDTYKLTGTIDVLENVDITTLEIDASGKEEKPKKSSTKKASTGTKTAKKSQKVSIYDILGGLV